MENKSVVIIGSSNIDYIGKSFSSLIESDSNPGTVNITFGGVGRNICENLARLDVDVTFITAIGNDHLGLKMEQELKDLKVKIIKPVADASARSASYLAIHDQTGDMKLALVDTDIVKKIDKEFLDKQDKIIEECDYLIIDVNLEQDDIEYLVDKYQHKKIICDGISTTKVLKLVNVLDKLFLLKINRIEYYALKRVCDEVNPINLIVSNGNKPLIYLFKDYENKKIETREYLIETKEKIVSATGAGDALLAGVIFGLTINKDVNNSIYYGIKLASITLDSIDTVNKNINNEMLIK